MPAETPPTPTPEAELTGRILAVTHPFDSLPAEMQRGLAQGATRLDVRDGDIVYEHGTRVQGLYLIISGRIDILGRDGETVSILGASNFFGERGLMRDGIAPVTARAHGSGELLRISVEWFARLLQEDTQFRRYFERGQSAPTKRRDLMTMALGDVMTRRPLTCGPETTLLEAAQAMRARRVSCILVTQGAASDRLAGIVSTRDLTNRALAEGRAYDTPVTEIMTPDPVTMPPDALISDVLHEMVEGQLTHMPVTEGGALIGILTQTDITKVQATSSAALIQDIAAAPDSAQIARQVAKIPDLLVQLVGAHNAHHVVTRLITDIADAATRRLLKLGEAELGSPPVDYLWLACGSQGRREQTGVSDQDNILILADDATEADDAYFAALAKYVSDGLDAAGYFYCPGDMMATAARWRQPLAVWRRYFRGWIARPDPEAQMLASVMFDLRAIGGTHRLFEDLQEETLALAADNSIFVSHMIANSLKHQPPLGLFRGLATLRSGEHRNTIDLKHNGVVPVVDLGRIYALTGQLPSANTRARLRAAIDAGTVSGSGGGDLLAAYDLIADLRLKHQAELIKQGRPPDNFMPPSDLSDFERSHLRDAFVVIKTMQNAAGQRAGPLN